MGERKMKYFRYVLFFLGGCYLIYVLGMKLFNFVISLEDPNYVYVKYPHNLEFVGAYYGDENLWGAWGGQAITISGTFAFLATPDLVVLDISNPKSPQPLTSLLVNWFEVEEMIINDNYLFLSSADDGILVFDISDPITPIEIGFFQYYHPYQTKMAVYNDYIYYYTSAQNEWLILNKADPTSIKIVQEVSDLGQPMIMVNNYVYAARKWGVIKPYNTGVKLQIIDVSTPANPVVISETLLDVSHISDIEIVEQVAYVSTGSGLIFVDVSDARSPKVLSNRFRNLGTFSKTEMVGNTLVGNSEWAVGITVNNDVVEFEPIARLDKNKLLCSWQSSVTFQSAIQQETLCSTSFIYGDFAASKGLIYLLTKNTGVIILKLPTSK